MRIDTNRNPETMMLRETERQRNLETGRYSEGERNIAIQRQKTY